MLVWNMKLDAIVHHAGDLVVVRDFDRREESGGRVCCRQVAGGADKDHMAFLFELEECWWGPLASPPADRNAQVL